MKHTLIPLLFTSVLTIAQADMLELTDGQLLDGTYQGGTAGTIRFQVGEQLQTIPVTSVLALTISRSGTTASTTTTVEAAPAASEPAAPRVVQAGTSFSVTLRSDISTASARPGQRFEAILAQDLKSGGVIAIPRGTLVRGSITSVSPPKRVRKAAKLAFTLDEMVVGGETIRITTSIKRTETGPDGSVIRGAAVGAIIGEIADNDAGKGASYGAAAGALKKGDHIVYRAGSNVAFSLSANITVTP